METCCEMLDRAHKRALEHSDWTDAGAISKAIIAHANEHARRAPVWKYTGPPVDADAAKHTRMVIAGGTP